MTKPAKVPHVLFVQWGEMLVAFPVTDYGLMEYPGQLSQSCIQAFAKLMMQYPDRPGGRPFLPLKDVTYRLRIKGKDLPLNPTVMMRRQFEGEWRPLDQEALDERMPQELSEDIKNGDTFIDLELIEVVGSLN